MTEAFILASVLVLFRCAAFVAFLPPSAGQGIPVTVRVGLAVALTALIAPRYTGEAMLFLMARGDSGTGLWVHLALLTARETALGAGLAWLFSLTLVPVRIAGAWVAQEMGLTMGGLASPLDQQPGNVVSQSLEAMGIILFFSLNLHHTVLYALGRTFEIQPVASAWKMPSYHTVTSITSTSIDSGFLIVAPVALILFIVLVTLLVTMRAAPQFNFMSYGMAMRVLAGMTGLVLFIPDICGAMQRFLYRIGEGIAG
ncbi:MAG: flagellar biosynthetic protein FliR [Planctomycetaceae bacterium]|nr:flagellar biosynthetic protein FliR [Planctomycetaceae bacterium]